jgi:hypothetical protein
MAVTVDPGIVALGRGDLLKYCTMWAGFLCKLGDPMRLDFAQSSGSVEPRNEDFLISATGDHELNKGAAKEFHGARRGDKLTVKPP